MTILVTPVGGIHQTWNQQIEMGMAPLTIFTDDPPGEFVLPAPTTLGSVDLKYHVLLKPGLENFEHYFTSM